MNQLLSVLLFQVLLSASTSVFGVSSIHVDRKFGQNFQNNLNRPAVQGNEASAHDMAMDLNRLSKESIQQKLEYLYDVIVQESIEAERAQKEYNVNIQEDTFHMGNADQQLKRIMLGKLKKIHEEWQVQLQSLSDTHQLQPKKNKAPDTTEVGRMVDYFLYKKINEMRIQGTQRKPQNSFHDYNIATANFDSSVHVMGDESSYVPIFKFDGSASEYCFPDTPSAANDNQCVESLDENAPVYYRVDTCNGQTVYTYYLWYGTQMPCIKYFDEGHGNDWEHVSVYVDSSSTVSKVVFHQHGGHYTRKRGTYQAEGERPIVYVGKVAHGSYHIDCNGRCSWTEFIRYGCYGSVRYCPGGCGYWDDFRNPGPELRNPTLLPLMAGETIDGLERRDQQICGIGDCEGDDYRNLFKSGCWQNDS